MTPQDRTNRIEALRQQILPLQAELKALRDEEMSETSPFKVGDIISFKRGNQRTRARVVEIKPFRVVSRPGQPSITEVKWLVRNIRLDGRDGGLFTVYPHYDPQPDKA